MDDLWCYGHFKEACAPLEAEGRFPRALRLMELAISVHNKPRPRSCDPRRQSATNARSLVASPSTQRRPYSSLSSRAVVVEAAGEGWGHDEEAWRCARHAACLCNSLALCLHEKGEYNAAKCVSRRALEVCKLVDAPSSCFDDIEVVMRSSQEIQATLEGGDRSCIPGARVSLRACMGIDSSRDMPYGISKRQCLRPDAWVVHHGTYLPTCLPTYCSSMLLLTYI